MRATIHNCLESAKARREENNDKGFSLIELIVVILVLGILIAVAFPIFGAVQKNAKIGALEAAAADGATVAAAEIALGTTDIAAINTVVDSSEKAGVYTLVAAGTTLGTLCVTATAPSAAPASELYDATITPAQTNAGPGCTS